MQSFFNGLTIWAYNVLPAVFPFMVITTIALKYQNKHRYSITKFLFNIDCDNALFSSVLCGYPIGAKTIADSDADENTATKMCAFCSSAGPIFMLATVGAKLLQNTAAAIILISAHFCSIVLNGLIYREKKSRRIIVNTISNKQNFGEIITNSALSIISVGGLIALFYMFSEMIKTFLPQELSNNLITNFVLGLFEMTNGIHGICTTADVATATVLCSALLAFGGLCVLLQCYAFLEKKA